MRPPDPDTSQVPVLHSWMFERSICEHVWYGGRRLIGVRRLLDLDGQSGSTYGSDHLPGIGPRVAEEGALEQVSGLRAKGVFVFGQCEVGEDGFIIFSEGLP